MYCDTKVCFLSQAGEYTALSYTWGCPAARCRIFVDDQPRLVTRNLWQLLCQAKKLRHRFAGWLWIDAISIEQSNPWEKLEQVKLISTIFQQAVRAVIWLGPAYGNSNRAIECINSEKKKSPQWRGPRSVWAYPISSAMLELCERPYWQRLWVYQKLKASQATFTMCGSQYVRFEALESLLYDNEDERVQAKVEALQSSSAGRISRLVRESSESILESMLVATRYLLCRDPRDRVYAVLEVIQSGHEGIAADYTMPLPDLVNTVLRNMHASSAPSLLWEVAEQCELLEDIFGMSPGSIYTAEDETSTVYRFPLRGLWRPELVNCLEDRIECILEKIHSWCRRHNHRAIARIVSRDISMFWGMDDVDMERNLATNALNGDLEGELEAKLKLRGKPKTILKSFEDFASSTQADCGQDVLGYLWNLWHDAATVLRMRWM